MSEHFDTEFEGLLRAAAEEYPYPPTPDIAAQVTGRLTAGPSAIRPRWAWAGLTATLLVAALALAHPTARAAVFEVLQVGAVRILLGAPTPPAQATDAEPAAGDAPPPATLAGSAPATQSPAGPSDLRSATPQPNDSPSVTPSPTRSLTSTPLPSILTLAEPVSLQQAERRAGFEVRLPGYPPELGPPSRVYLLELESPMVILVWEQPHGVGLSLHIIKERPGVFFWQKNQPRVIADTVVGRNRAYWVAGPYYLEIQGERRTLRLLVEGNVLIWSDGELTYRLESDLEMDQAIRIAESLE